MRRSITAGGFTVLATAVFFLSVSARAGTPDAHANNGILVKVLTRDGHGYVGEIKSETDDTLTIYDLKTGHDRAIDKPGILRLDRDVSDDAAVVASDLQSVLLWKIDKLKGSQKEIVGKIARISDDVIYTTLGADRVSVGTHVTVFRDEGQIKDPDTGKVLGIERPRIGELEITDAQDAYSKGKRLGDIEIKLQVGDIVEIPAPKFTVAVFPPVTEQGTETPGGSALGERLTTRLVNGGISVVERARLLAALAELSLQNTALFDPNSAQKFGKQVGASDVLTGMIEARGSNGSEAHIRLIDVQTGAILLAASAPLENTGGDSAKTDSGGGAVASSTTGGGTLTKLRANLPSLLTSNRSFGVVEGGLSLPGGTYIRTKDGGFLDKDFTFDVYFIQAEKNPSSALIGIGSGIDGEHATPKNSIFMSIHPRGNIDMNDREGYGGKGIGDLTDPGTYVVRIQKEGFAVTFSLGTEKDGKFTALCSDAYSDVRNSPDTFNSTNMHIFFGAGVFTQFRFTRSAASHE